MPNRQLNVLMRQLRRVVGPADSATLPDARLLERFISERDETAFELLLRRHGSMVLSLCRRLLRHEQDAEDAFQATFLTLVRKAGSISKHGSLASWLYKVAYRIALAARGHNSRKQPLPAALAERLAAGVADARDLDLQPLLDEEVRRLPDKYRVPFILCYYQGKTNEEAARELGCPKGTILSRLSRARSRLRVRLTRRGIAPSAVFLTTATAERGLSVTLLERTLSAALLVATGNLATSLVSAKAITLSEGVMRAMFYAKLKVISAVLLVLGLAGSGFGILAHGNQAVGRPEEQSRAAPEVATVLAQPPAQLCVDMQKARALTRLHLKRIALALQAYHDTYAHLPAPAIYSREGKPLLSWRVALLPFLEQDELYRMFRLDEPWDGAHNKLLLGHIPKVYQPAADQSWSVSVSTLFQVFVGPGAAFEQPRFVGAGQRSEPALITFPSFTDGLANTILVSEADTGVEWTKPADLEYAPGKPLPRLGSQMLDDFQAVFADGSVYTINKNADPAALKAAVTRNGGEKFDMEGLTGPRVADREAQLSTPLQKRNRMLKDRLAEAQHLLSAGLEQLAREKERLQQDAEAIQLQQENARLEAALERVMKQIEDVHAELAKLKKSNPGGQR